MNDWVQQVTQERDELQKKIEAQSEFIMTDYFLELGALQQELLRVQLRTMLNYIWVLKERLAVDERNR